jgi:hypothetical protein
MGGGLIRNWVNKGLRDRSLIMGEGAVGEKRGAASTAWLIWGRPQTEKYVTRGDPNFLILSYLFSKYLNLSSYNRSFHSLLRICSSP